MLSPAAFEGLDLLDTVERLILDLLRSQTDRAPDLTAGVPTARRRDDGKRS